MVHWTWDAGHGTLDMGRWTWDTGHGILDTGHGILDTGHGILDTGHGILDTGQKLRIEYQVSRSQLIKHQLLINSTNQSRTFINKPSIKLNKASSGVYLFNSVLLAVDSANSDNRETSVRFIG